MGNKLIFQQYSLQSFNSQLIIKEFTKQDLQEDGTLVLLDAFPGDVVVINNQGRVIYTQQMQYKQNANVSGVKIELSSYNIQGTWKVRYNKSSSIQANIDFTNTTVDNLILYSLIFN